MGSVSGGARWTFSKKYQRDLQIGHNSGQLRRQEGLAT